MTSDRAHDTAAPRAGARFARDFILALALFGLFVASGAAAGLGCDGLLTNPAHARLIELPGIVEDLAAAVIDVQTTRAPPSATEIAATLSSLALAFASLVALNLWFIRHLGLLLATDAAPRDA